MPRASTGHTVPTGSLSCQQTPALRTQSRGQEVTCSEALGSRAQEAAWPWHVDTSSSGSLARGHRGWGLRLCPQSRCGGAHRGGAGRGAWPTSVTQVVPTAPPIAGRALGAGPAALVGGFSDPVSSGDRPEPRQEEPSSHPPVAAPAGSQPAARVTPQAKRRPRELGS